MRQKTYINPHSASPPFPSVSKHSPKAQMCVFAVYCVHFLLSFYQVTLSALFMSRSKHSWRSCQTHNSDASHVKGFTQQPTSTSKVTFFGAFLSVYNTGKIPNKISLVCPRQKDDELRLAEVFCICRCFSREQKLPINLT